MTNNVIFIQKGMIINNLIAKKCLLSKIGGLMENKETSSEDAEIKSSMYLVFQLDGKSYGIPILKIDGIIGLMEITPLPKTPKSIKGVINLRGQIIPIVDLRLKFEMSEKEYNEQTCIIVVNVCINNSSKLIGLVVDIVSEVFDIPISEIEPPPNYGQTTKYNFLTGIGKMKEKVVMLLDIEKIINADEAEFISTEIKNDLEKV